MKRGSELRRRAQGILPFDIEQVSEAPRATSYSGLPLVAEIYCADGAPVLF